MPPSIAALIKVYAALSYHPVAPFPLPPCFIVRYSTCDVPKRSPADFASDNEPASSSDIDVKPHTEDDSGDSEYNTTPKKQKKSRKQNKVKTEGGEDGKPRPQIRKWTAKEDAIFLEVMEKMCLAGFWQEIKTDGRLAHRGAAGIRAHFLAFFKKAKKSNDGELQ